MAEPITRYFITPNEVRTELMDIIQSLCIWECDDASVTRSLFYIQGACDLADSLIKRMEGQKECGQ